jgi:hypothetical protein
MFVVDPLTWLEHMSTIILSDASVRGVLFWNANLEFSDTYSVYIILYVVAINRVIN